MAESLTKRPFQLYVHPKPQQTVLPFLQRSLPSAATQEYATRNAPASHVVLASYPPASAPPPSDQIFSTAVIDPNGRAETALWFWSSVLLLSPDQPSHGAQADTAGQHLRAVLQYAASTHPEMSPLRIGNLHACLAPYLPASAVLRTDRWDKLIFTPDRLPPADPSLAGAYRVARAEERHLDAILASSAVARGRATVFASPNTVLLSNEDGAPLAWCFTSRSGNVSTLFVQPAARGRGLAKAAMRGELVRAFEGGRAFVGAEVGAYNEASLRLCESMGARKEWEVVSAVVDLEKVASM